MIKHFVIFTFEKDFFKEEHYKEYCELRGPSGKYGPYD